MFVEERAVIIGDDLSMSEVTFYSSVEYTVSENLAYSVWHNGSVIGYVYYDGDNFNMRKVFALGVNCSIEYVGTFTSNDAYNYFSPV